MMPILVRSDDVRSGRKSKVRHGRHRSQWVKQRPIAEVSGRVFVLTGIFIKGVIKYEHKRCEPLWGTGGIPPPPQKFLNLEARKCYFQHCARQYFKLDGV